VNGDVTWVGLLASLSLIVIAIGISRWQRLGLERSIVVSVGRATVQLLVVGFGLGLVLDDDAPLAWSWLWVAGIVVFAAVTIQRRAPAVPGLFRVAVAAELITAVLSLGVIFGLSIFPLEARTLVPVSGMILGNALSAAVLAARRLVEEFSDKRDELEARLALGCSSTDAARPYLRVVLRTAMTPQIESTKAVGLVFLPGAMTGLVLAGVDPVDAVLVQLALMLLILGGVAIVATVTALGAAQRLFTPDERLIPLLREAEEG
jgi:putative ABC transport system permease protein